MAETFTLSHLQSVLPTETTLFLKLRYYWFTTLLKSLLRLNTPSLQIANVILLAKLCMCTYYSSVLNKNNFKQKEKLKEKKQHTAGSDGQK